MNKNNIICPPYEPEKWKSFDEYWHSPAYQEWYKNVKIPAQNRFHKIVSDYVESKGYGDFQGQREGDEYYLTLTDGTRLVAEKASYDFKYLEGEFKDKIGNFWTFYFPEYGGIVAMYDGVKLTGPNNYRPKVYDVLIPNSQIAKVEDEWKD